MSLLARDFLAPFRRRTAPAARSPLAEAEPVRSRRGSGKNRIAERPARRRRAGRGIGSAENLERRLALAVDIAPITGNGFFFVDTGQGRTLDSEYSGYAITNNNPVTYADVWVQAHDFTGGVLNLSPNEDGVYHLGQLDPGETDRAWFYLTATGASVVPQSHVISVYDGDPREGGTLIPGATETVTFNRVEESIEASANKVFSVAYDTLTPVLGGTLAMTVTGNLGQAGGDSVLFTPDTFNTWQPGVFELETVTITITGTNARTVTDELFLTGFAQASDNPYTAVYTFRVVDVIATETPVSPTQFVGRNTQWKHDQPIGVDFPPVPAVTNPLLLEKLVAEAGSMDPPAPAITVPDTGETVEFTLTFTNSSTRPASLDSIRDTLPMGTVYVPGSATFGGLPIGDPTISGSKLTWLGPFPVPPTGSATLTFEAVMPAMAGVYVNSSVGRVGSVQIDTTLNTKDDAPATATVTCAKFADLAITKTDGQPTDIPGTSLVYTITVTNLGPSGVTGVPVTDDFPASLEGVTWTVAYAGGATGPMMGAGDIDVLLAMPAGSSATFTVTTTIDEEATGTLLNTATVGVPSGVFDPNLANNTSTDTTLLEPTGDLSITKTDGQMTDVPGTGLTYTIVVTNPGPSAVTGALINDAFPPELTDVSWGVTYVGGSGPLAGTGPIVNQAVNLSAGGTATFTVTAMIVGTARGTLSNTATVTAPAGFTDPNLANNSATDTTILLAEADLAVVKTRTSGEPVSGESVSYLISVTNNGPSTVLSFTLTDTTAPALIGATFGAPSMGSYNAATGAWTGLMLATGQTVTITLTGTVPGAARGDLANTAVVAPPADVTDPDLDNNTSIVTDVLLLVSDLAVTKVRTSDPPVAGLPVTYLIQVTNNGPTTVMGFTLTDTTAPGLIGATFGTPSAGSYDSGTGAWTGLMLATGQSVTITLSGTVPPASVGLLQNTAEVMPPLDVTDPNLLNNTATVSDVIAGEADLAVLKARTSAEPVAGAPVEYLITVTNKGPSTILGFTLTDTTAPALIGATFGTPSMGSYNPVTGAWTGLMLATGESVTITLSGTVPGEARGNLVNTAEAEPPAGVIDPTPDDNTFTVTDVIGLVADLAVVKIRTSGQPVAGETVTYQITVTNQGPTTIDSFTGTDTTTPALEGVFFTVSTGTYDSVLNIWTADPGDSLATGETVTFTLTGTVPSGATGLLVNTVKGLPPDGVTDPDLSNNTSTVTDELAGVVDLTATKTGDELYTGGLLLNFTVVITNNGPSFASGVRVEDALPAGVINWSWTVSYTGVGSGTADGSPDSVVDSTAGIDKLMNLAVLGTATFTITALTDADFKLDITNTVVATLGQETATASWTSSYEAPPEPTQDVAALVVSNDDLCFGLPYVRVLDAETGATISQFLAYESSFRGSVRVATGDVTGDGIDEIVVAPGRNRIGQIRVFTPEGVELTQYRTFAFGPAYRGGVNVAVGDIDGDGDNDIIAARSSGLSRVNVFGVNPLVVDPVTNVPIRTFIGIPGAYRNGAVVTSGDYGTFVNGMMVSATADGIDEIAVGSNAGIRAQVRVFDASTTPRQVGSFVAIRPGFRGGVTLSTARWNTDTAEDIVVGAGVGGQSIVEVYGGTPLSQFARLAAFSSFGRPNAVVNAAALDISGDGVADNLYGVQGRGGSGGTRGVRRFDRSTTTTSTLPSSTNLVPPLRIAPITLRILGG
ncbi:MAG: FG-GAP-like repeat-containing protein [Planctomycetota bacterium]